MSLAGIDVAAIEERGQRILAKLYDLADDRSRYGAEIVLRTCPICGAEEGFSPAGRLVMRHGYERHTAATYEVQPLARPVRARSQPATPFGGRDDD